MEKGALQTWDVTGPPRKTPLQDSTSQRRRPEKGEAASDPGSMLVSENSAITFARKSKPALRARSPSNGERIGWNGKA